MKKITLFLILYTCLSFSQSDKKGELKTITGIILNENKPLSKVNISIQNESKSGTISNSKGFFSIKAKEGMVLIFDYIGLKTVKIYIEDITSTLNIEMKTDYSLLDEISITSKSSIKDDTEENNKNEVLRLGRSNINVKSSGFGVKYISGKNLNQGAFNIIRAIQGKAPGLKIIRNQFGEEALFLRESSFFGPRKPVLWDVDGIVMNTPPLIDVSQVVHIAILSSLGATNAYGGDAAGGVVIISTESDFRINKKSKKNNYTNKEYYNSDAISYNDIKTGKPDYLDIYKSIPTANEAYVSYKKNYSLNSSKSNFHLNTITFFQENYADTNVLIKLLTDFETLAKSNVEDLKTIAYKYQELNEEKNALRVYKKIAKIRPKHAQSYRDLANSYIALNDYKNAWKIYKYYLKNGFVIEDNDIGNILNSEMVNTYVQRKKDSTFNEVYKTSDSQKVIESDVRFVFEWNTSEAEFILEFVNPNNQAYQIENSLNASNDLIIDQKTKGYTSKEFMLEKLENSPWLVNVTYLGNKQYKPTIFKVTTYYNWGKINQSKEIKVFELNIKNVKTLLNKITL